MSEDRDTAEQTIEEYRRALVNLRNTGSIEFPEDWCWCDAGSKGRPVHSWYCVEAREVMGCEP